LKIGIGFDIHRLVPGRPLLLGGVSIPFDKGLLGHSDGDVLLHAMIDAVLGASGHGDIGEWFSDQDPANKGKDSTTMIPPILEQLHHEGLCIVSFDSILFAEKPRLSPYKASICEKLAEVFQVSRSQINLKAKTMEGLGSIGEGLALAAQAVVLLQEK
jgi:2-C-methyl-D-erythritol 2,4-cyclodiphosphate synthase